MAEDRFHWEHFSSLGEELLDQAGSADQCRLIERVVADNLDCKAQVWLGRPAYPLPGETDTAHLLDGTRHPAALFAYRQRQPACLLENDPAPQAYTGQSGPLCIALPFCTRNDCLGILLAEKEPGQPFSGDEIHYLESIAAHAALALQVTRQAALKNWRFEQINLLRSVSGQITQVLDLEHLFRKATHLIQESYGYFLVSLYTLQPGQERLVLQSCASSDAGVHLPEGYSVRLGSGTVGMAAKTKEEQVIQEGGLPGRGGSPAWLPQTQSEAALPLKIEDRLLGVLHVQSTQAGAFYETDLLVLRSLADNIAIAIEEARVYFDLERRADQVSAILEISHKLNSILNLDELLQEIVQVIHHRFGYPFVQIFSVHPNRRLVIYETSSREHRQPGADRDLLAYPLDDPSGIIPWVARNNKPWLANDILSDPLYRPYELLFDGTRSELAVPLSYTGSVVGVMDVQSDQKHAFTQNDIDLLGGLAAGIAIAIRNATVYKTEQWQRQVASSLNDVAGLIGANTALETLLDSVLYELERNLPCEVSVIWLFDDDGAEAEPGVRPLKIAAIHGADPGRITTIVEQNPEIRQWLNSIFDFPDSGIRRSSDFYGPLGASLNYPKDYSAIAFPLRSGSRKLGIIEVAHPDPNLYGSEAGSFISTFAGYAAVAIQNARLYADAQKQAWASNVLLQVADASRTAETTEDLFLSMARIVPLLVGVDKCALFLRNEGVGTFEIQAAHGFEDPELPHSFSGEHPAFAALKNTLDVVQIDDPAAGLGPAAPIPSSGGESLLLLPLLVQGSLVGACLVTGPAAGQPGAKAIQSDEVLPILQGIAHQIAVAYENLRLTENSRQESYVAAVMLQVAQTISTQNSLADTLQAILALMPQLVGTQSCVVYVWDPQTRTYNPLQAYTGSKPEEEAILQRPVPWGTVSLLDRAFELDRPHSCPAPESGSRIEWGDSDCQPVEQAAHPPPGPAGSRLMAFPLSNQGQKFGLLVTKESGAPAVYPSRRIEMVTGIAQQIAYAIENETLKQRMLERERIDKEFELARQIQMTFLPEKMPEIPGWDFNSRWQTAMQVGGDFYDIFMLDGCHIGMVVADVSDKGMPAAMYMSVTRMLLRAYAKARLSPASVLEKVNEILIGDTRGGMFVTAAYAILCTEDGKLSYANAGHSRPILLHSKGKRLEVLPKGDLAMGVMENVFYKDYQYTLDGGDFLFMYTDGVTEAFSPAGETFGEGRLQDSLLRIKAANSSQLLAGMDQILSDFRENSPVSDDLTILCAHRRSNRSKTSPKKEPIA